ncbi:MAG: CPBP family intramembrane metalloprotease [Calditrichaeota bacterium]|nr:CPBP family intramembrane metalloprotease [Calditrichota bacterium]
MSKHRSQLKILAIFILANALLAFLTFALKLYENVPGQLDLNALPDVPAWLLGIANGGIIIILYGVLGILGYWLARKMNLPGIYRRGAGWNDLVLLPLIIGVAVGLVMIFADKIFTSASSWNGFPHPPFPMSIFASATAGIGEEILYRGFVLSLWAFLLNIFLKRWHARSLSLTLANVIAALAFGAAHLPGLMMMMHFRSISSIPPIALAELFLLNGIVGLAAGDRFIRDGLVAAIGVHFWADIVWHVIFPLI